MCRGRIYGFECDCADGRQVEALVESVRDITGNREAVPDVIINSAGAGRWLMLDESTIEEIKVCFDAPVLAAANVTKAFLGGMQRRGAGAIVNIQSPAAITTWVSASVLAAATTPRPHQPTPPLSQLLSPLSSHLQEQVKAVASRLMTHQAQRFWAFGLTRPLIKRNAFARAFARWA
jgi:NAD(P)-dependent dehydrogenase (short-subunit alcohol dehydrogenase family)